MFEFVEVDVNACAGERVVVVLVGDCSIADELTRVAALMRLVASAK
jgi:hypothetical protein